MCSLIRRCKAVMQQHMEGGGNTKSLLETSNRFYSLFSRCQLTEPIEILSNSEQHEVFNTSFPRTHRFTYCFSFDGIFFKARLLTSADHPARPPRFSDPSFFFPRLDSSFACRGALPLGKETSGFINGNEALSHRVFLSPGD